MITILLPAYNEELSLPKLLPKIDAKRTKNGLPYYCL
jgi:glycosyltransferase involved in cell wall biosynthesis